MSDRAVTLYQTALERGVTEEQYSQLVEDLQARHKALRQVLARAGSLVLDQGVREEDADIPPRNFTRNGIAEYVSPPQDVIPSPGEEKIFDHTPGYTLTSYHEMADYDPNLVRAHLRILYDDATAPPRMAVIDVLGSSEFSEEIEGAIRLAFEGLTVAVQPA